MRVRFLVDDPGEGALNMAVDETLFLSASDASRLATVRLYGFDPPAVSFGYRQKAEQAVDLARCRELGIDCVRRPTGGRALLHQHELTYSVAAPLDGLFRGLGVRAVYDSVSAAIRRSLSALGIPVDPAESEEVRRGEPALQVPCLAHPGRHEIASGGRKIVASAQRRGRRAFLQHGSLLRRVDTGLWERLLRVDEPSPPLRAVGIDELLPQPVPLPALMASLLESFQQLFDAGAEREGLTREERQSVRDLLKTYRVRAPVGQVDNVEAVW